MAATSLPVADFALLGTDCEEELLEVWDFAFRTYGCCILRNHGYNKKFEEIEEEALKFFKLPLETKMVTSASKQAGHLSGQSEVVSRTFNGYNPYGTASVSKWQSAGGAGKPRPHDAVESMLAIDGNFSGFPGMASENSMCPDDTHDGLTAVENVWKFKTNALLRKRAEDLHHNIKTDLLPKVMKVMAKALKIEDENIFMKQYGYDKPSQHFRMSHYLPTELNEDENANVEDPSTQIRFGEHTDYEGLTFLWRNQVNGLQVKNPFYELEPSPTTRQQYHRVKTGFLAFQRQHSLHASEWIDVLLPEDDPNALVINAGDMIQRITNDYYKSVPHRVIDTTHEARFDSYRTDKPPISLVFFTGPSSETQLEMVPSPLVTGPFNYPVVSAKAFKWTRMANAPEADEVLLTQFEEEKLRESTLLEVNADEFDDRKTFLDEFYKVKRKKKKAHIAKRFGGRRSLRSLSGIEVKGG
jgi:isopenicillin N synthase-like dioxygenase